MKAISGLWKEAEPSVESSLKKLSVIVAPEFGLIRDLKLVRQYYDEPKFWDFSAKLNSQYFRHDGNNFQSRSSGVSFFSEKLALLKCLGEAVERYCNFVFLKSSVSFTGSFNNIKGQALNPVSIRSFSKNQLRKKAFKRFRITEDSRFRWTRCQSLITGKYVYVPCQLIYLSYPRLREEPTIYPSISTGVAGGACLSAALTRGIYELIERDAFMIYYLNKLQAPKIQLSLIKDVRVQQLLKIADRYKMEVVCLDITTDLNVPAIAAVVINRIGIGKAISVGLRSDLNPVNAIIGAITEAFHTRLWLRKEYEKDPQQIKPHDLLKQKHSDLKLRGLLWYPAEAIEKLNFWIESRKRKRIQLSKKALSSGEQLRQLLAAFDKLGYYVYYKNLMITPLKHLGYFVVKVCVPQMQPLYLNEKFPLLGGERLYTLPAKLGYKSKSEVQLNGYPHPFL